MRSRRLPYPLITALTLLIAAGCGSDATEPDPGDAEVVRLLLDTFQPADITISPGTTVRWVNDQAVFHTITPEDPDQPGVFPRMEVETAGQVREHTFTTPGVYEYFCEPHLPFMTGTIRVE